MQSIRENINLCFSNKERHTLIYNEYVKNSLRFIIRNSTSLDGGAVSIARTNRCINHGKLY